MKKAAYAMLDDFGESADPRCDHWHLARHGFERRQAETFLCRRQQKDVAHGQERHDLFLCAHYVDEVRDPQLAAEPRYSPELGAIAHQQKARGHRAPNLIEYGQYRFDPLDRAEIGDVSDDLDAAVAARESLPQV